MSFLTVIVVACLINPDMQSFGCNVVIDTYEILFYHMPLHFAGYLEKITEHKLSCGERFFFFLLPADLSIAKKENGMVLCHHLSRVFQKLSYGVL